MTRRVAASRGRQGRRNRVPRFVPNSANLTKRAERGRWRGAGDAGRNQAGAGRLEPPDARGRRPRWRRRAAAQVGSELPADIVTGFGGKQILLEDPSGNPIEPFEPTRPEARLIAGG